MKFQDVFYVKYLRFEKKKKKKNKQSPKWRNDMVKLKVTSRVFWNKMVSGKMAHINI